LIWGLGFDAGGDEGRMFRAETQRERRAPRLGFGTLDLIRHSVFGICPLRLGPMAKSQRLNTIYVFTIYGPSLAHRAAQLQ
jgi:hypothetical protein